MNNKYELGLYMTGRVPGEIGFVLLENNYQIMRYNGLSMFSIGWLSIIQEKVHQKLNNEELTISLCMNSHFSNKYYLTDYKISSI